MKFVDDEHHSNAEPVAFGKALLSMQEGAEKLDVEVLVFNGVALADFNNQYTDSLLARTNPF